MAPTDYVSDWSELYGRPVPTDGSLDKDEAASVEAKVVAAPESAKPTKKTAEVK